MKKSVLLAVVAMNVAVLIALAPGPDNLMVLSLGMARGRAQGVAFGLGCALGCLNHTLLAALGAARMVSPLVDGWSDGKELVFGAVVVAVIGGSYLLARRLARRRAGAARAGSERSGPRCRAASARVHRRGRSWPSSRTAAW